jgi:hypothetical protein
MFYFWLDIFSVMLIVPALVLTDWAPNDRSIKRYGYLIPLIYALTIAN